MCTNRSSKQSIDFWLPQMRRWKMANLAPLISADGYNVRRARNLRTLQRRMRRNSQVGVWGATEIPGLELLVESGDASVTRLEDGFLRSVGLGSDMVAPLSIVADTRGIYFDPSRPSDLENLLSTQRFTTQELARAEAVRHSIVKSRLTKYNKEHSTTVGWITGGRKVVFVPGQVDDDASIRLGSRQVTSNLALLARVRELEPEAFIVYKPHPDVLFGNRQGDLAEHLAQRWADHIETRHSVLDCLEACDLVHTMTSLTGFDALLRGKPVVTHGEPFYAGWGLTEDLHLSESVALRRSRNLSLESLIAGTLLYYPKYWDPYRSELTTCERVVECLVYQREEMMAKATGQPAKLGFLHRQARKIRLSLKA